MEKLLIPVGILVLVISALALVSWVDGQLAPLDIPDNTENPDQSQDLPDITDIDKPQENPDEPDPPETDPEIPKDNLLTSKHFDELTPNSYPRRCINTYPQLAGIISKASSDHKIPEELIAAIITSESSWDDNAVRYEPLFDATHVSNTDYWHDSPHWIEDGPTIREWFDDHPYRISEKDDLTEEQLDFVAQTRISSSYGLMQVLYTSSVPFCNYQGSPEDLRDITISTQCGTYALRQILDKHDNDLVDAISAYNAGEPAWHYNYWNREYTKKVIGLYYAYLEC